eukprot:TRINITY_DN457_c0_g1_i1.p1 TRINITY_DN457_c0_g1~~TRINITY_DN457_c0_g1_i1.p1  ORF type:complete len:223 (+),score=67.70 TRINITY_DN457_c0_g1_i1:66-734(+)
MSNLSQKHKKKEKTKGSPHFQFIKKRKITTPLRRSPVKTRYQGQKRPYFSRFSPDTYKKRRIQKNILQPVLNLNDEDEDDNEDTEKEEEERGFEEDCEENLDFFQNEEGLEDEDERVEEDESEKEDEDERAEEDESEKENEEVPLQKNKRKRDNHLDIALESLQTLFSQEDEELNQLVEDLSDNAEDDFEKDEYQNAIQEDSGIIRRLLTTEKQWLTLTNFS